LAIQRPSNSTSLNLFDNCDTELISCYLLFFEDIQCKNFLQQSLAKVLHLQSSLKNKKPQMQNTPEVDIINIEL